METIGRSLIAIVASLGVAAASPAWAQGATSTPTSVTPAGPAKADTVETLVSLRGDAGGRVFDGIGVVDGGGATSVLLKDYPEPQRSQILDMLFKPKFGASVSALLVEIPGDGNSTQGSMPSHMHTRDDLNYSRGYTWWLLREAKRRNPGLTLTGLAWSAPAWIGGGNYGSQDMADYYVSWLKGLRDVYGLGFDAIGVRNEKGVNFDFAELLRGDLNANGFGALRIQGFDNWTPDKVDFVKDMLVDKDKRDAIGIISAHTFVDTPPKNADDLRAWSDTLHKPIWNSEEHVYKKGFDAEISIVQAFNLNYIRYGVTLVVNWYGIAALYPMESYSETPAALLARSPWSGNYAPREALWGYAHYGQFSHRGWLYLNGGSGELPGGGSYVTLKSPTGDYSIMIETKDAKTPQVLRFDVGEGLSRKDLNVWRSDEAQQFVRQGSITPASGRFSISLQPSTIYTLSTTTGQQKGQFDDVPAAKPFPFPYRETFREYARPQDYGYLPHYTADIAESFELVDCVARSGQCLRQVVPAKPMSWAPEWRPYTIIGDDAWHDYEASADVYLNAGESAGIMGRVNDVGYGYGSDPKGYILELDDQGLCRLIIANGKPDKKALVGDAEQQALILAAKDKAPGGESLLGQAQLPNIARGQWHNLKLRFQDATITAVVDGAPVLTVTNAAFSTGMVGLMADGDGTRLSRPYFDNLIIKPVGQPDPDPTPTLPGFAPIYQGSTSGR